MTFPTEYTTAFNRIIAEGPTVRSRSSFVLNFIFWIVPPKKALEEEA